MTKTLIYHNNTYKYYSNVWYVLGSNALESDYMRYGMEDVSIIPELAWQELTGTVELFCYSDDINKEEIQFNIETERFTLIDEFEGKDISIIEYIDSPILDESIVSINTEPFTFYDEMGDNFDVLYYTDNKYKTKADLEITHNYSVLDDLEGDFDVVTYTDNEDTIDMKANINSLPVGQIVVDNRDIELYGLLNQISVNRYNDNLLNGVIKLLMSFDSGNTWYSFNNDKWIIADVSSELDFINKGIKYDDVVKIANSDFSKVSAQNKVRLAYYLDESIRDNTSAKISNIKTIQNQALDTPILDDASFYIVNTVSTINLTLTGKNINGKINDIDGGKVKYKVSINGQPYYPENGGYTEYSLTPLDINLRLSNENILIDKQNTLRVDIMDYWGETDFWETTFIGTYNGLIFKDINGGYYSDDVGNVIKYLDFGTLIAGQVSTESEIRVFNNYGYPVKNLTITPNSINDGVVIELSKTTNPFMANKSLSWDEEISDGESKTFFVRISTDYTTPPVSGGMFEIRVDADQVV